MDRRDRDNEFELYEVTDDPYTGTEAGTDSTRPSRRRQSLLTVVVIVVLVVAGLAVWRWHQNSQSTPSDTTDRAAPAAPSRPAQPPPSTPAAPTTARTAATSTEEGPAAPDPEDTDGLESPAGVEPSTERRVSAAARAALTAYGNTAGKSSQQWLDQLMPHLARDAQPAYERTPPGPALTVTGVTIKWAVDDTAEAIVNTDTSGPLKATLVWEDEKWLLRFVSPADTASGG